MLRGPGRERVCTGGRGARRRAGQGWPTDVDGGRGCAGDGRGLVGGGRLRGRAGGRPAQAGSSAVGVAGPSAVDGGAVRLHGAVAPSGPGNVRFGGGRELAITAGAGDARLPGSHGLPGENGHLPGRRPPRTSDTGIDRAGAREGYAVDPTAPKRGAGRPAADVGTRDESGRRRRGPTSGQAVAGPTSPTATPDARAAGAAYPRAVTARTAPPPGSGGPGRLRPRNGRPGPGRGRRRGRGGPGARRGARRR